MADHTIELTNDELKLVRNALHSYLDDFGHKEADLLREIKQLLEKLPYHERFFEELRNLDLVLPVHPLLCPRGPLHHIADCLLCVLPPKAFLAGTFLDVALMSLPLTPGQQPFSDPHVALLPD